MPKHTPTWYALKHPKESHVKIDESGTPYVFGSRSVAEVWARDDDEYKVVRIKISIIK